MPQPVDLQSEAGRLATVERVQQIADRTSLAAQQRAVHDADRQRVASETQVQQTPHAQSEQIDAEARRRNPFVGRRRRRRMAEAEPHSADVSPASDGQAHQLDVKV